MSIISLLIYNSIVVLLGGFGVRFLRIPYIPVVFLIGGVVGFFSLGLFTIETRELYFEITSGAMLFLTGLSLYLPVIQKKDWGKIIFSSIFQLLLLVVIIFPFLLISQFSVQISILLSIVFSFSSSILLLQQIEKGKVAGREIKFFLVFIHLQFIFLLLIYFIGPILFGKINFFSGIRSLFTNSVGIILSSFVFVLVSRFLFSFLGEKAKVLARAEIGLVLSLIIFSLGIVVFSNFGVPIVILLAYVGILMSYIFRKEILKLPIRGLRNYVLPFFLLGVIGVVELSSLVAVILPALIIAILLIFIKLFAFYIVMRNSNNFIFPTIKATSNFVSGSEMSLVLLFIVWKMGYIDHSVFTFGTLVLVSLILIFPFIESHIEKVMIYIAKRGWLGSRGVAELDAYHVSESVYSLSNHVIVCGFGKVGREVQSLLEYARIPYIVIVNDDEVYQDLLSSGKKVVLGNPSEESLLYSVGVASAKSLVVVMSGEEEGKKIISYALSRNPKIHIICASSEEDRYELLNKGANTIIVPEFEAGVRMGHAVLDVMGVKKSDIISFTKAVRKEHFID